MNKAIFLVAALALCALPGALGLMCYKCEANITTLNLCNKMENLMNENCTMGATHCAMTSIMAPGPAGPVTAYVLGCVPPPPADCSAYNASLCDTIIQGANDTGSSISSCMTTCCNSTKCNMPIMPTASSTVSPTPSVDMTTPTYKATTTAGVEFLGPKVIALLVVFLAALYFGDQ